jgi:hypothetical protein
LVDAEPEQVDEVGVEPRKSAPHPLGEVRVDHAAAAQHAEDQLLSPPSIASVERAHARLEDGVE